jgi:hypothetical protein
VPEPWPRRGERVRRELAAHAQDEPSPFLQMPSPFLSVFFLLSFSATLNIFFYRCHSEQALNKNT